MVEQALAAANRGDNQQAAETLSRALEIKPHAVQVCGLLAQIYARMGSFDRVSELIEHSIRENPRQYYRLHSLEGLAYSRAGQLQRALVAFKLAISRGPFSRPEPHLQRIKSLETELRRKARGF